MATLPGVADLGPAPKVSVYRPASVGGYDTSGYAAGGQALARGAEQLGAGVSRVGADIGDMAANEARWQEARATSGMLADNIDLRSGMTADRNYGKDDSGKTLFDRYADGAAANRDKWAATISDPAAKDRFVSQAAPRIEQIKAEAAAHTRSLWTNAKVADYDTVGEQMANKAVSATDDATKTQVIDAHNNLTSVLRDQGVFTPTEAVARGKAWVEQYATADALAAAKSNDPQRIQAAANRLRTAPGTPADVTDRILEVEGTDKNGRSSATGAGQFIDSTWLETVKKNRPDLAQGKSDADILALRADKGLGREMTEAYRAQNEATLKNAGVAPTPGNQYLAHFLGPAGAIAVARADPKMPIADALAKAVGPDKAQAMIAANPGVLQGQLAGSVTAWADGKMGGSAGGHIYDTINPVVRERLSAELDGALRKVGVESRAQFLAQQQDQEAEALNTGGTSKPALTQQQFVAEYGAGEGPFRYQEFDAKVQAGRTRASFAQMTPEQRMAAVDGLMPQPGEANYAVKARNHEIAQREDLAISHELHTAPADFAIARSPAAREAWENLKAAQSGQNTMMTPETAARNYAAVTTTEQRRAGAQEPQILPKGYAENLSAQLRNPDAAGGPGTVLARIESEAKLWGAAWPQAYREIAPKLDPTLRVVAAGVDPTAGKLLLANHDADEAKILGTQYEVKKTALDRTVTDAIAPIAKTFVGSQEDETRRDYVGVARKLAAIYISKGTPETTAATQAVAEIIGSKYDIKDTYRVPHDAGVSADQVASGVAAAKALLAGRVDLDKFDLAQEKDNMGGLSAQYLQGATASALGRDGKWVTAPDEKGLMLTYKDEFWPSAADMEGAAREQRQPKPFMLTWAQLADIAEKHPPLLPTDFAPAL